jgi:cyclase
MRREFAFGMLLAGAAPQAGGPGAAPIPDASAIQAEKIRDRLYVLRGGGRSVVIGGATVPSAGNTTAFVTARGVVLVDTKLPGWGKPILEKLKEITDKPVVTVINTHTHMDHVGGNVEIPDSVEIVAHENTAKLMREMRPVTGGPAQPNLFAENGGRGLPTRTFSDHLTIGSGEDRVEIHYFGRAHTGGDAWVRIPALGVLICGDAFGYKAVPPLDANNGASGVEYPKTLSKVLAAFPEVRTLVTGHYPTTLKREDLETHRDFMDEFVREIQAARRSGRTVEDFAREWRIPDRFAEKGYVSVGHLRPISADVEVVWNETP